MSFKDKIADTEKTWHWNFPWDKMTDGNVCPPYDLEERDLELLYAATCLGGETGELLNKVKKVFRQRYLTDGHSDPKALESIPEEMADVLFYLFRIAKTLNIDLDKAWSEKMVVNDERYNKK